MICNAYERLKKLNMHNLQGFLLIDSSKKNQKELLQYILSGKYEDLAELSFIINEKAKKYYCIESTAPNGHWTEQSVLDLVSYLPNTKITNDNNFNHVEKKLHICSKSNSANNAVLNLFENIPNSPNYIFWTFFTSFKPYGAIIHHQNLKADEIFPILKFLVDFRFDDQYEYGFNPLSLIIQKHYIHPNSNCKILQNHIISYRNTTTSKKSQQRLNNKQKQYHNFAFVASQFQGYKEICYQDSSNQPNTIEILLDDTKDLQPKVLRTFVRIFPDINILLTNAYSDFESFGQTMNFEIDTSFKIFSPYVFCIVCYMRAGTGIPIGYIIGPSETHELYNLFFESLRKYIGESMYDKIKKAFYFESDQGRALISFYKENQFNHCFCHVHILRNFGTNLLLTQFIKKALRCKSLSQWMSTQVELMFKIDHELYSTSPQNEKDINLYQHLYTEDIYKIYYNISQLHADLASGMFNLEYLMDKLIIKSYNDFFVELKQIYDWIINLVTQIKEYCNNFYCIESYDPKERINKSNEISKTLELLKNHYLCLDSDSINMFDNHSINYLKSINLTITSIYEKLFQILSLINYQNDIILKFKEILDFGKSDHSNLLQIKNPKPKKSRKLHNTNDLTSSPKFKEALNFLGLKHDLKSNQIHIVNVLPSNYNKWALWERHGMPPNTNFIEGLHGNLNRVIPKNMKCGHKLELFDQFLIKLINNYNQRHSYPLIRYLKKRFKAFYYSMKGQITDPISENMIIQERFLVSLDIKSMFDKWVIEMNNKATNIHLIESWLSLNIPNIPSLQFSVNENPLIPHEPIHMEYSSKESWFPKNNDTNISKQSDNFRDHNDLQSSVNLILALLSNQHVEGTFPEILQIVLNILKETMKYDKKDHHELVITTSSGDHNEKLSEYQNEIAEYIQQYYLNHQKK